MQWAASLVATESDGPPAADVYALGTGLRIPSDLTLATIGALRRSSTVFALPGIDLSGITDSLIVDLSVHYSRNRKRADSYRRMAAVILMSARERPPVSFLTYGNPVVGTEVTRLLCATAAKTRLRVEVVNAPSSIEAVCAILKIDPFQGLQLWEASAVLAQRPCISRDAWLFLMQVPYVGATTATHLLPAHRYDAASLTALRELLVDHYSECHVAYFVRTAMGVHPTAVRRFCLGDLVRSVPANAATLAVPPFMAPAS